MNEKAPESFATNQGENKPTNLQGSRGSSNSESRAEVHDRLSLQVVIIAFGISLVALTVAIMGNDNLEDRVDELKDAVIKAETELQLVDDWLQQHGVEKRNGRYVFKEESRHVETQK